MSPTLGTALLVPEPGSDAVIRRLKQAILLFDKIAVLHLSGFMAFLNATGENPETQAELEWLVQQSLLTDVPAFYHEFLVNPFQEAAEQFPNIAPDAFEYASRVSRGQLEMLRWRQIDAVLVCGAAPRFLGPPEPSRSRAIGSALGVVFEAFPVPDDQTPWEQILEFKRDPDTTRQVLALRRWASRVARQLLPAAELHDEIEWLVREYEAHMRLHRLKVTGGVLETVVTSVAEVVENLAKLKLTAAAKGLFSFRQRRIQLLEAERQAPGRELVYLVRARREFGPRDQLTPG
jgi:hypothetical protein